MMHLNSNPISTDEDLYNVNIQPVAIITNVYLQEYVAKRYRTKLTPDELDMFKHMFDMAASTHEQQFSSLLDKALEDLFEIRKKSK